MKLSKILFKLFFHVWKAVLVIIGMHFAATDQYAEALIMVLIYIGMDAVWGLSNIRVELDKSQ